MPTREYLGSMVLCYLITIAVESAVLIVGLSRRHSFRSKCIAGLWLTACTYPVVWLVLPRFFPGPDERWLYLLVAEAFAPIAECILFQLAFLHGLPSNRRLFARDMLAIIAANFASFGVGELIGSAFWD